MQIDVVALLESIQQEFHQGVMVEDPPDRFERRSTPEVLKPNNTCPPLAESLRSASGRDQVLQ